MTSTESVVVDPLASFLSFPNHPDEIVPWMLTTGATSWLPVGATIMGLALGLVIEGYLDGSSVPIDPNSKAYPGNYWMELSGLPVWPPMVPG
jgi:hypothetical protein